MHRVTDWGALDSHDRADCDDCVKLRRQLQDAEAKVENLTDELDGPHAPSFVLGVVVASLFWVAIGMVVAILVWTA